MSTFACGGGSSMGYKRAGYEVVAANDIDPQTARHYRRNLAPRHYFLCPIRDLLAKPLPAELHRLDILDGSPPCSTFSMAGDREKGWGKEKYFREGQAKQVLSDLFFDFLDVAERLRPRAIVAENVKGMVIGNAKGYAKLVLARLREIGYRPQLFLLNAADYGVPQRRVRVFFCAVRGDIAALKLDLAPPAGVRYIGVAEALADLAPSSEEERRGAAFSSMDFKWWPRTAPGDAYSAAAKEALGQNKMYSHMRLHPRRPAPTLTAHHGSFKHWAEMRTLTFREFKRLGSFPDDYWAETESFGKYLVGMSVPPKMAEYVAREIGRQWLGAESAALPVGRAA
jgi:DNA (cytosine-5)-methyltransferase 1